jgi:thioredoxin reductase (NADPH)
MNPPASSKELRIVGDRDTPAGYELREFLFRSGVAYEWQEGAGSELLCYLPDGACLRSPSVREVALGLGFVHKPRFELYDLSIYGAGPAGLSAALSAASEGLKTILIEKGAVGGQATTSSAIENYLGFPDGISGAELAVRARRQAVKMGADILLVSEGIDAYIKDGLIHNRLADGGELVARAGICATGVDYRKLELPEEARFYGAGLYYGAGAGEARFCSGREVFVVGGGNSAGQAALYFAKVARKVTMLVRGPNLSSTLSRYLIDRIAATSTIEVRLNTAVTELRGGRTLEGISVRDSESGVTRKLACGQVFVCIGGNPNNAWSRKTRLIRDEAGYFVTGAELQAFDGALRTWTLKRPPFFLETNVAGVFAIGDVRHNSVKRIASAVGEGAVVTALVEKYLAESERDHALGRTDTPGR